MATLSINSLLNFVPLTAAVQKQANGLPKPLPEKFYKPTKQTMGDKTKYFRYPGQRQVAKISPYGSPARQRNMTSLSIKEFQLVHSIESLTAGPDFINNCKMLNAYGSSIFAGKIQDELDRQAEQFGLLFSNLRTAMVHSMIANGKLWFDSSGNLLPSSSGVDLTVDYEVPANNLNQLNGIISASWATAGTNISLQISQIQAANVQAGGKGLKYAIYGKNISSYLLNNTALQGYFARNSGFRDYLVNTNEIADGTLGLTWIPARFAYYVDNDGTTRESFGGDTVTFLEELDSNYYCVEEGSYEVPTTLQPQADMTSALDSLKTVYGMFGYAVAKMNPVGFEFFMGDTFLPRFPVPERVFIADVTP